MVEIPRSHTTSTQILPWVGAALVAVALTGAPGTAAARTYEPQPIGIPDGDPTADDQPDPAPKRSAPLRINPLSSTRATDWTTARLIWLAYVRAWIRITAL
jgi:hypothetical protein